MSGWSRRRISEVDGMIAMTPASGCRSWPIGADGARRRAPVMQAQQEELGDLKLYRIPEPVTVAARSQKQVALLQRPGVQVRTLYRARFYRRRQPYERSRPSGCSSPATA